VTRAKDREGGVAVLLTLLVVLGVGIGLVTSGLTRTIPLQARTQNRTLIALAEAKQALIGRAVADDDRPGSLPCPDAVTNDADTTPNDGIADKLVAGHCPSYIGRLPWKTLGIADLRDEYGERLWYALSPKYRDDASAQPINSDTPLVPEVAPFQDRLVYANSTANVLVQQAVAVIFAPGSPMGGQLRDATPALCTATGTIIARNLCVGNYLDATDDVNNASLTGPYIAASKSGRFNDRVMPFSARELMPLVEMRVARELREVLLQYRVQSDCQCFPWAGNALGESVLGDHQGRVPSAKALPEAWGGDLPVLPSWFDLNRWGDIIYYTVGKTAQEAKGKDCKLCTSPTLLVDGVGGYSIVFMTPGAAAGVGPVPRPYWSGYVADIENRDGDDWYIQPRSKAMSAGRMTAMPGASPLHCEANAKLLLDHAPCEQKNKKKSKGKKKKGIKGECAYAVENLQVCTCAKAAEDLLDKPCSKKIKNPKCKTAVATVKTCN
jgi:hypothetical protein